MGYLSLFGPVLSHFGLFGAPFEPILGKNAILASDFQGFSWILTN